MIFIICFLLSLYSAELKLIHSIVAQEGDYEFAGSLSELHTQEKWGWHSGKIGRGKANSELEPQDGNTYQVKNLHDLNLKTAWVEGEDGYGEGTQISFTLSNTYPNRIQDFNGIIEIFNGYCKSETVWKENARVEKLKVLINDAPICLVQLADTWQYQKVDLSPLISGSSSTQSRNKLKEGDILVFEIVSVYLGTKYKDVALSELVTPSYGGG